MPELPEVETLTAQLNRSLQGLRISRAEIRTPSVLETPPNEFGGQVQGRQITQVKRRGKYIQIELSSNQSIWFHLGMTGQLLFALEKSIVSLTHIHFTLSFEDTQEKIFYRDVRRFGHIALSPTLEEQFPEGVRSLGPEPSDWGEEDFASFFRTRRARIKSLLLNQTLVAGLGNIYADESLYRAGIRPLRRAHRIGRDGLRRLHRAMCEVLGEAIEWGGSSIDDYLHLDGTVGKFQEFHRVYGRGGEKCGTCGSLIRSVKLSGRTSSFCPHCQK